MNITKQQMKTPLLSGQSVQEKRQELKAYFLNSWQTYESLFALINNHQAFYSRPEPLRHPLIFYYGHTATFYINKLILGQFIHQRINDRLEAICAVGVDEMSWDDLNSEHYNWPSVDEVRTYRDQVKTLVCDLIDSMPLTLPITQDSLAWIILMGSEHERIHLETSSVIMRMLPLVDLTPNEQWQACPFTGKAPENKLLNVDGGQVTLGKTADDDTYGWDNEYGSASIELKPFKASKYLVTNQEFLHFIDDGGYQQPKWWTEEGQQWLSYTQAQMPRFWLKKASGYFQRNLLEEIPLPLNWPVEVNQLEAKAFCNWKSSQSTGFIRLPTEPEWYALRAKISDDLTSWKEAPGNINLEYFASSCPVDRFSTGATSEDFYDIIGNVWQWTESPIDAFDGFNVHPLYDDFSTPTFDGKHNLIKGGSWISTGNEAIKNSRYAFRRHFFQHAGFRYVESENEQLPLIAVNHFENNTDVCQQLHAHYGKPQKPFNNYQLLLAQLVNTWVREHQAKTGKLLDLGCSVGRTSFELSPNFDHIDGVDFSARYIQHGVQLQTGERVRYQMVKQGDIVDYHELNLANLNFTDVKPQNIFFSQADPSNLKAILTGYDVILAQQVLEQCYDPKQFLADITSRLNADGLLILASDYQFDESVADKAKWLGGIKVNGENVFGFEGIGQVLTSAFECLSCHELPQVIMQSQRNYRVSQKHITLWRRRG